MSAPKTAPVTGVPAPPPLPADLEALLRRLRMPHVRRHAPEVLATAKAQRWEPAEVLKALLGEEVAGRDRSALATRRAAAGFPTGKTFDAWDPGVHPPPGPAPASGGWRIAPGEMHQKPHARSMPHASRLCTDTGRMRRHSWSGVPPRPSVVAPWDIRFSACP